MIANTIEFEASTRGSNARYKTFQQVAAGFEPPDEFKDALTHAHTIVVGPRGSGKTTLLKMLHPAALTYWRDAKADEFRRLISFSGVYVPTDRLWRTQLDELGGEKLDDLTLGLLTRAVTNSQILGALIQTMFFRTKVEGAFNAIHLSGEAEQQFVLRFARLWELEIDSPSLLDLMSALQDRVAQLYVFASREVLRSETGRKARLAENPDLHVDFVSGVSAAIATFNNLVGQPDHKWAFLFDELELAPDWLTQLLFGLLRSTDQSIYWKLSTSPVSPTINPFLDPYSATEGNDYNVIRLWHARKEESLPFTQRLLERLLKENGIDTRQGLDVILPADPRPAESRQKDKPYAIGGRHHKTLVELQRVDTEFADFLVGRRIDVNRIEGLDEKKKAEVRKFMPIAEARLWRFKMTGAGKLHKRSAKRKFVPVGHEALCALVEGNPRLLTQIVSGLMASGEHPGRFRAHVQRKEISLAIARYMKFLETVPLRGEVALTPKASAEGLVRVIGEYFERTLYDRDRFSPEPHLSFRVDPESDDEMLNALSVVLNAGAIILDTTGGAGATIDSVARQRCRLCYLLHAHFGLPFVLGEEVSLTAIFESTRKSRMREAGLQLRFPE